MDMMNKLVKHLIQAEYKDLPENIVERTKTAVLDTLGSIIAGSSAEGCRLLVEYLKDWGGKGESTVFVFGGKMPCPLAAQANGAMSRAYEIDDVLDSFPQHPSASLIPACLSISEKRRGITGKELISAVALGHDIVIRLAHSIKINPIISGRYNLFDVFAVTAAAGKLFGLSEQSLLNAVGIAYSQMVADAKAGRDGVMTSFIQQGTKSKSAIEAVLMAEKGITGTRDVLQGHCGFYYSYEPDPNIEALETKLGEYFSGEELAIKPYGSCRGTHQAIDLALKAKAIGVKPETISHIIVHVNEPTFRLVCDPTANKRQPQTPVEAQFSLPFTVAAAFVRGSVFIDEFSEQMIQDPTILKLAAKVKPVVDQSCQTEISVGSVTMKIEADDGEPLILKSTYPKGNPKNPLTMKECILKFEKCISYSRNPFSKTQSQKIIDCVDNLEHVDDICSLVELLIPV